MLLLFTNIKMWYLSLWRSLFKESFFVIDFLRVYLVISGAKANFFMKYFHNGCRLEEVNSISYLFLQTVSVIILSFQNDATPNHESLYWQKHSTIEKLLLLNNLWPTDFIFTFSLRVDNHNHFQNNFQMGFGRWHSLFTNPPPIIIQS